MAPMRVNVRFFFNRTNWLIHEQTFKPSFPHAFGGNPDPCRSGIAVWLDSRQKHAGMTERAEQAPGVIGGIP
jgi:hypothetical protein